jgi:lysophospholipase L1-like esterase
MTVWPTAVSLGSLTVFGSNGRRLATGTAITVCQAGTGDSGSPVLLTLWVDAARSQTLPNPTAIDSNGDVIGYTDPGVLDLARTVNGNTYADTWTLAPEAVDLAGKVTGLASAAVVTSAATPVAGQKNRYNATAGNLAPLLPALSGLSAGPAEYYVEKDGSDTSTNTVTITCAGSDKFENGTTTTKQLGVSTEYATLIVVSIGGTKYWALKNQGISRQQLEYRYSPAGFPTDIGPRTGRWDPSGSIYNLNAHNTRRIRAAVAIAAAGVALASLFCKGDSTTVGKGTGVAPDVASMPVYLAVDLASRGVPSGGTGWVFTFNNNVTADSRWALSGFTQTTNQQLNYVKSTAIGSTAAFTTDKAGTQLQFASFGTSAAFTWTLKHGATTLASGTFAPSGLSAAQIVTATAAINVGDIFTITTTSASSTYIAGARVSGASGLEITNGGISNSQTLDWLRADGFQFVGPFTAALQTFHGEILSLGINDGAAAVTAATFKANLLAIATADLVASDVILWVPPTPDVSIVSTVLWTAYRSAYYDVADQLGIPLVDIGDAFGTYTAANALGLMFDTKHPNKGGYQIVARDLAPLLAA